MKKVTIRYHIISILVMILILNASAYAQDAKLTNIIVTNTKEHLLLYLTVEGAFREKMEKAILSGVPITFSFLVQLSKTRSLWWDKNISDIHVTHTIKYDNLKKEFIIRRSWEGSKPKKTPSFKEAKALMMEIDSLKIIPLHNLIKGKPYQIRAKAELSKLKLPLYLHYVLFFLSLWDFETDWYTIDFTY